MIDQRMTMLKRISSRVRDWRSHEQGSFDKVILVKNRLMAYNQVLSILADEMEEIEEENN